MSNIISISDLDLRINSNITKGNEGWSVPFKLAIFSFLDSLKTLGVNKLSDKDITELFTVDNYIKLLKGEKITIDNKTYDSKQTKSELFKKIEKFPYLNKNDFNNDGFKKFLGYLTMSSADFLSPEGNIIEL